MSIVEILILIAIGLAAGMLSGLFGVGGGIIIVPALVFFMGMSQHSAQGTSLGLMLLPIGILAAFNYYKSGNLNVQYGIIVALAFVAGGYFGSKLSIGMNEALLTRMFGLIMLAISIKMIFFPK
jgi:uncharacterized membrane protein YfcA